MHGIIYTVAKKSGLSKAFADRSWANFKQAMEEARLECIRRFGDPKKKVSSEGIMKSKHSKVN